MKLAHSLSLALAVSTMGVPYHTAGTASEPAAEAVPGKAWPDMAP
jgi:hypothetical protein